MDKTIDVKATEAFLVKAFKLTTEELASLYNEAGELTDFSLIETKDTERIKKLSGDSKNQYSRGLKEASQKIEKEIKEKYEVESDLIGVELIDHIIETKLESVKGSDDVLKNPEVIKLINQHSKEKKALAKEYEAKLEAKEREVNEANLFKEIESNALTEFDNLKPILPEDAKKAAKQKGFLVSDLKRFKYQKADEGVIVLKEDGTPLKDKHGYNISFQDHVKQIADEYFDFRKADDRSSSGNNNQHSSQQGNKIRKPKDDNDYIEMMRDNSLTSEERIGIMKLHTSNNK